MEEITRHVGHMNDALPEGWARVKLPEIADINMGQSPPGSTYNSHGEGLPFFQGKADFGERYPTPRVWCTQPRKTANPGDVLISVRAPVGPTNLAQQKCVIGRGLAALCPLSGITSEFILFALRLLEPRLSISGTGSTFTAISKKDIESIDISLPPLAEQKRIVAKVEELLARLNATKERLARVKEILKRFRQSVLAAACSGRLTEDWRARNLHLEPALELVKQIKKRAKEDLKYTNSDISNWVTVKVESLYTSFGGGTPSKSNADYWGGDIPWIASGDVKNDRIGKGSIFITEKGLENSSAKICQPDSVIVVVRSGILRHTLPVAIAERKLAINQDIKCFDSGNKNLNKWLFLFLKANQNRILALNREGTTVQSVRYETLKNLHIDIPPFAEQREVRGRIEALFNLADEIENRVEAAGERGERLKQAILAKAFGGSLVPTEAELARREHRSYESASALLRRISRQRKRTGKCRTRELGAFISVDSNMSKYFSTMALTVRKDKRSREL
jgi:type I restriction enzyme S subunit